MAFFRNLSLRQTFLFLTSVCLLCIFISLQGHVVNVLPYAKDTKSTLVRQPRDTGIHEFLDQKDVTNHSSNALVRHQRDTGFKYKKTTRKMKLRESKKENDLNQSLKLIPEVKAPKANCSKIFNGNKTEIDHVFTKELHSRIPLILGDQYLTWTKNCAKFKSERRYILRPLTEQEKQFPIAYSIMIYKDISQFERLLRAIYMPQNYYCIHVDGKSNSILRKAVESIASCFDNVFLTSRSVMVKWGEFTALEPDIICMRDLLKHQKWKYLINLTGQEFPMQTNGDLVEILKAFNGSAKATATIRRRDMRRVKYVHAGNRPVIPRKKKSPPPHGIRITRGAAHIIAPRATVEFIINNPIAKDFLAWVNNTGIPDETFFSTLIHNPQLGVPGAFKGIPEVDDEKNPVIVRYKNWKNKYPCAGKNIRSICIISVGDLPFIKDRHELFINKLHSTYSPSAYDCLEEFHFQHMRDRLLGKRRVELDYYRKLEFTWNHV